MGNNGMFESKDGGGKWIVHKAATFNFQPHSDILFPFDATTWMVTHGTSWPRPRSIEPPTAAPLGYQQGFFTVARTCSQCRGAGKVIAKPCPTCHGEGRVLKERKLTVKIPPGIATGQRLRIQGEGESGVAGGPPGDLYVVVQVQDHEFLQREGNDLLCDISVAFTTLALGGSSRWRASARSRSR